MDTLSAFFQDTGLDFQNLLITSGVLLIGMLLFGGVARLIFGKRSIISCSVSSAIGIIFIYALAVALSCAGNKFQNLVVPLPFVTITDSAMSICAFQGDYTFICAELLSMVILSFLVNIIDRWMPKGKNIFTWTLLRALTVAFGYILHLLTVYLFAMHLPVGFVTYAPVILLGILVLLILTGFLRLLVGLIISTVDPVAGGIYTFFFAHAIGTQLTKAVLTTALLGGLVMLLNHLGIFTISIAASALVAYIPFVILVILLWYLANHAF